MAKSKQEKFKSASETVNEINTFDKAFSNTTEPAPAEPKKQGRPPKAEHEKLRGYRYNLNLDKDLKGYLHEMAWRKRTNITQYINDLIRADMEEYIRNGGDESEWTTTN